MVCDIKLSESVSPQFEAPGLIISDDSIDESDVSPFPFDLPLRNRYFIVRHGESLPSLLGIILSNPDEAKSLEYGLTERGQREAEEVARKMAFTLPEGPVVIYTSDFARARQTAEILQHQIDGEIKSAPELRERFFGQVDRTSLKRIDSDPSFESPKVDPEAVLFLNSGRAELPVDQVLERDRQCIFNKTRGAESVAEMCNRLVNLVERIESEQEGASVVLVSHGDPLRRLQCLFAGTDPRNHGAFWFSNCDVRELRVGEIKRL